MNKEKLIDRYQFLVRMAYDGSKFFGVQEQGALPTVLGVLRKRIEESSKIKACALVASARTDRDVSALNNYATFYLKGLKENVKDFIGLVEKHRDDGLYGVSLKFVSHHVHARSCSGAKIYRYTIIDAEKGMSPFAWGISPKLDIQAMREGAEFLVGEHDFSSLRGGGCEAGSTIKTIFSIELHRCPGGEIIMDIHGSAFLRKMIRNLVGLLAEVGAGLRRPQDVEEILAQKDRQAAGIMAPAQGLSLLFVEFVLPENSLKAIC